MTPEEREWLQMRRREKAAIRTPEQLERYRQRGRDRQRERKNWSKWWSNPKPEEDDLRAERRWWEALWANWPDLTFEQLQRLFKPKARGTQKWSDRTPMQKARHRASKLERLANRTPEQIEHDQMLRRAQSARARAKQKLKPPRARSRNKEDHRQWRDRLRADAMAWRALQAQLSQQERDHGSDYD